jgi:hypothetical protein
MSEIIWHHVVRSPLGEKFIARVAQQFLLHLKGILPIGWDCAKV